MKFTLNIPAAVDAVPLSVVSDAMARRDATDNGTLPLHGPTLIESTQRRSMQLVSAAKNGTLVVCNDEGVVTSANDLIAAVGFSGEPQSADTQSFSQKSVSQLSEVDILFVKRKHLNDWAGKNGDELLITDMPVQVVEFGPKNEKGEFAYRGWVGLPIAAAQVESAQPHANGVPGKLVTPEKIAEVQAYRNKHGATKAAKHFKVSRSLVNAKTEPKDKKQKTRDWTSGFGSRKVTGH